MLISEARVETGRPGRYLVQLCRHLSNKGRHLGRRPGGHQAGHGRPEAASQARVEWTQTSGMVSLPWGECAMRAADGALTLRASAADEESLQRIEGLITSHLDRFSRRDHLAVNWHRTGPAPRPGETS